MLHKFLWVFLFFTLLLSCKKESDTPIATSSFNNSFTNGQLATLSTLAITNINSTGATCGGNVLSEGGNSVTQRGICWSINPNPTISNNITMDGSGIGIFTSNLAGLSSNTMYYVRAYAINSLGVSYGNQASFRTASSGSVFSSPGAGVNFDGHNYSSVILGNGQEWMSENLRTTIYANGEQIPNVGGSTWQYLITGAWCFYNNNYLLEDSRGKLYNFYTVSDQRNVCPAGWHVPSLSDWRALVIYLDSASDTTVQISTLSQIAGGMMKGTGTSVWQSPNTGATNQVGLSFEAGGLRDYNIFQFIGQNGIWWTTTGLGPTTALGLLLSYNYADVRVEDFAKDAGASIRCLKD